MRLLLFFFIIFPVSTFATGPSVLFSKMNPVSVNDKGEILCRTRYFENNFGARCCESIEYGLCVISNSKIIEYKTKFIDYSTFVSPEFSEESYNEYERLKRHYDWVFKIGLDFNNLSKQQKRICDEYGFKENNVEQFKVNKKMKIADFEEERNTNLVENKQLALKKATSTSYKSKYINILYDFGEILFLDNLFDEWAKSTWAGNIDIGATFSYMNPLINEEYEINKVTGVLFLNESN